MNHAPISWIPKWDVLFELHTLEHLRRVASHTVDPAAYLEWLGKQPGPEDAAHHRIYMQERFESIPASEAFPREAINAWFSERGGNVAGCFAADYYTSTVSYMLALAIMEERPEIHVYGVDLLQEDEYAYQRAGAEYLIGFARGMGIKVYVPRQSALCAANYVYGFSEPAVAFGSAQITPLIEYIEDKAKVSDGLVAKSRQDANTFNGALQMADLVLGWIAAGGADGKDVATLVKEKRADLEAKFKAAHDGVLMIGGQSEAFRTSAVWAKHFARGGALTP